MKVAIVVGIVKIPTTESFCCALRRDISGRTGKFVGIEQKIEYHYLLIPILKFWKSLEGLGEVSS